MFPPVLAAPHSTATGANHGVLQVITTMAVLQFVQETAMSRRSFAEADCDVAEAAQQAGDKWRLVMLRDAFNAIRRFDEFAEHPGLTTHVLASRLNALVAFVILVCRPLAGCGRAFDYTLTPKGFDLVPLIVFRQQ